MDETALPVAAAAPKRRRSGLWLVPLLVAVLVGALFYSAWMQRGIPVEIRFSEGHGLKTGDALRHRGIVVGRVRSVSLDSDLRSIRVDLRLEPGSRDLARSGSRFWIVRPELDLSGASGLETVIGANYLRVIPGDGSPAYRFEGLDEAPILALLESGGLELDLRTANRGGLRRGAPVMFRQVVVGRILSVGVAPDAGSVAVKIYVEPRYKRLIRRKTRFWKAGGVQVDAGLWSGVQVRIDSVDALVKGGVALALPADPGEPAVNGQRFELFDEPDPKWLEWSSNIALYSPDNPGRPVLAPASLSWRNASLWTPWRGTRRSGWLLALPDSVIGPADLLAPPGWAEVGSGRLAVQGREFVVAEPPHSLGNGLAQYSMTLEHRGALTFKPLPKQALDVRVLDGEAGADVFLQASQLTVEDEQWRVRDTEERPAPGTRWHGAAVLGAGDNLTLGVLLVDEQGARIVSPSRAGQ